MFAAPLTRSPHGCRGKHHATLERAGPDRLRASVAVPNVCRWWPHTHGEPVLYDVALHLGDALRPLGATGFRTIEVDAGADGKGFGLRINGVPVFAAARAGAAPRRSRARGRRHLRPPRIPRATPAST